MIVKALTAALTVLLSLTAHAGEIRLLSAGAVEPGLHPVLAAFTAASSHTVQLTFAAAPEIRERSKAGAVFDVVIAPAAVLDDLATAAKIDTDPSHRVTLGRVGVGVAVRPGVPLPDISSADAFARLMREADALVFNRASTGLYVEQMLRGLGIEPGPRATRFADGAAVMNHVLKSKLPGVEIGLGATTEILLLRDQGLQFVGPLPASLQNFTSYLAISAPAPAEPDAARALLRYLASPDAQARFVAAGITPAP